MHTCNRNRNTDAFQLDLIHLLIGKGYFFGLKIVLKKSVPVALIGSWQVIC